MRIRQGQESDAQAIARFTIMAEGDVAYRFTGADTPETAAEGLLPFILSPVPCRYSHSVHLVAEVGGKVIGALAAFPADLQPELDRVVVEALNRRGTAISLLFFEGEPGTYYLSTAGIDPAYRGRGVGSALIRAAEAEGARQGFAQSSLLVSKEKNRARALYERLGYKVIGQAEMFGSLYHRMAKSIVGADAVKPKTQPVKPR